MFWVLGFFRYPDCGSRWMLSYICIFNSQSLLVAWTYVMRGLRSSHHNRNDALAIPSTLVYTSNMIRIECSKQ